MGSKAKPARRVKKQRFLCNRLKSKGLQMIWVWALSTLTVL